MGAYGSSVSLPPPPPLPSSSSSSSSSSFSSSSAKEVYEISMEAGGKSFHTLSPCKSLEWKTQEEFFNSLFPSASLSSSAASSSTASSSVSSGRNTRVVWEKIDQHHSRRIILSPFPFSDQIESKDSKSVFCFLLPSDLNNAHPWLSSCSSASSSSSTSASSLSSSSSSSLSSSSASSSSSATSNTHTHRISPSPFSSTTTLPPFTIYARLFVGCTESSLVVDGVLKLQINEHKACPSRHPSWLHCDQLIFKTRILRFCTLGALGGRGSVRWKGWLCQASYVLMYMKNTALPNDLWEIVGEYMCSEFIDRSSGRVVFRNACLPSSCPSSSSSSFSSSLSSCPSSSSLSSSVLTSVSFPSSSSPSSFSASSFSSSSSSSSSCLSTLSRQSKNQEGEEKEEEEDLEPPSESLFLMHSLDIPVSMSLIDLRVNNFLFSESAVLTLDWRPIDVIANKDYQSIEIDASSLEPMVLKFVHGLKSVP